MCANNDFPEWIKTEGEIEVPIAVQGNSTWLANIKAKANELSLDEGDRLNPIPLHTVYKEHLVLGTRPGSLEWINGSSL